MSQLQVTGEAKIRDIQGPVVANSGVITALDGAASQYVRGDGTLADFPTSTGGGSSVSYYLNSSVSQGTIGGVAYRQLGKTPIAGAGTDIVISANGYVASYLTDANDPALLEVPAGNFNCEFYFAVNSNNHDPYVYAEVYKYDGTTFTLIGSSQSVPEYLTNGTTLSPYYFAIPVTQTTLAITDRIAIRIYVNVDGRVVTLHTENNHLCQVVTTFSKGLTSLNNLTRQVQFLATGTSGTDFNISSSTATHTFNLPIASATNTGKLSSTDWSTFNNKQAALSFTAPLDNTSNTISIPAATSLVDGYLDNLDWVKFDTAYNRSLTSAAVTGTTTKTLTLNKQDGGTITASWTDDNTDAVTSVFGRTGAVVATSGDYNTSQVTELTNLYFTDARSRAALSFTAGSGAYNSTTGVITIPTNTNQLTNGASFITLASLSAGTGITYNNTTGVITNSAPDQTVSLTQGAGISISGTYPSFTIASTITQYTDALARAAISLTTTGTSGAATYNSTTGVFNIPNYAPDLSGYLPLSGGTMTGAITLVNGAIGINVGDDATISDRNIANTMFVAGIQNSDRGYINFSSTSGNSLGATNGGNLTWRGNDVGTVTSVGLSSATSGVTIGSTPITTSGTITLAIATASGSQNGLLSSTDWTTFNNKYNLPSLTSGSVLFSNGSTIAQDNANFFWDDTNNRLGIGTATPSFSLDVVKAGANAIRAYNSDSGSVDAYFIAQNTTTAALFGTNNVGPYLYTASALDMQFYTSAIERMRIFSDGNILIGNAATNAGYKLDVSGTGRFTGALTASSLIKSGGTSSQYLMADGSTSTLTNPVTGTGTTNYLPKFTGTSTIGDSAIVDNTLNVTIAKGNAANDVGLQVQQTSNFTAAYINITANNDGGAIYNAIRSNTNGGTTHWQIDGGAAVSNLVIRTGGTERLRIDASGNLGLGVTPSAWAVTGKVFQFGGAGAGASLFDNGVNDTWYVSNTYFNAGWKYISTGTATQYYQGTGQHIWYNAPSGTAGNAITFTQAMTLASTGNLLVGTTTDAGYKLDVNGTGRFRNELYVTGANNWELQSYSDGNLYINRAGVFSALSFNGSSGAATFSSSVTATSFSATDIESGVYANYFGPYSGGSSSILNFLYGSSGSVTWNNGGEKMSLSSSGTLRITTLAGTGSRTVTADSSGNLSASSDSSLKQEDTTHKIEGLAEILQLQPRAYKWLSDIEIRGEKAVTEIGFYANEVNKIIPSAAPKGNDDLYGFYDRAIIAALVKSVQELELRIKQLENK